MKSKRQPARTFVIGDVHANLVALKALLGYLAKSAKLNDRDHLIFLGDFVDRGPDSVGVLRLVRELCLTRPNTRALLGNHDAWVIESFIPARPYTEEHARWLRSLPHYLVWGEKHFISHAPCLRFPNEEWVKNKNVWELRTFKDAIDAGYDFVGLSAYGDFVEEELVHDPERIGVCGHLELDRVGFIHGQYICADSGIARGETLSAVELNEERVWSVDRNGTVVSSGRKLG